MYSKKSVYMSKVTFFLLFLKSMWSIFSVERGFDMESNFDQEYAKKEQEVLKEYWYKLKESNPDIMIPLSNGQYVHPDFSELLQDLGEKEVSANGYMLGVDSNGALSEDSIQRIDEAIEIILDDLYKSREERFEARQYRVLDGNEESFDYYDYMVSLIAERYDAYTKICEAHGITPHPVYEERTQVPKL